MENRSERIHKVFEITIGIIGILVTIVCTIITIVISNKTDDKK